MKMEQQVEFRTFFFFKQKTAYEITYGDWSSDVCSSDLLPCPAMLDWPMRRWRWNFSWAGNGGAAARFRPSDALTPQANRNLTVIVLKGSSTGVDISSAWFDLVGFPSPLFYARPSAGTSRETVHARRGRRPSDVMPGRILGSSRHGRELVVHLIRCEIQIHDHGGAPIVFQPVYVKSHQVAPDYGQTVPTPLRTELSKPAHAIDSPHKVWTLTGRATVVVSRISNGTGFLDFTEPSGWQVTDRG